jgi:hypothetical protein
VIETIVRCPMPRCEHYVRPGTTATTAMETHLIQVHGLPEVSASSQAGLLLPVTTPRAA